MYPQSGLVLQHLLGFPRTRGDVPFVYSNTSSQDWLPPHTRGCTFSALPLRGGGNASPAHAGMYPQSGLVLQHLLGFPRTRGDVPFVYSNTSSQDWLPPHTRGCTFSALPLRGGGNASPAHAGMYPQSGLVLQHLLGFPRTRGDVPFVYSNTSSQDWLPPHTRGCTFSALPLRGGGNASPAHAGMYPQSGLVLQHLLGFPRTRGDVPFVYSNTSSQDWLPPHTRGCTLLWGDRADGLVASPAHAGMYLCSAPRAGLAGGFPRTRGDVPVVFVSVVLPILLPPHTRGCTIIRRIKRLRTLASPAHAGMYP